MILRFAEKISFVTLNIQNMITYVIRRINLLRSTEKKIIVIAI